jgi:2-keto-3-deoxy-6-phosphogluconate aldolase
MPAGYRITEASDSRILENGDVRVTEGFQTADVALSATSSFDFVGKLKATSSSAFVGTGSLTSAGDLTKYAAILVANSSTLSALGARKTGGETSLSASGSITADEALKAFGAFTGNGTGIFSPTGRVVKFATVVSGQAIFTRITENEDFRITESGDNRITNAVPTNEIIGSMVANDTYIPFSSTAYYKTGGIWKQTDVDTKHNGNWDALQAVYKKISGNWKRIY